MLTISLCCKDSSKFSLIGPHHYFFPCIVHSLGWSQCGRSARRGTVLWGEHFFGSGAGWNRINGSGFIQSTWANKKKLLSLLFDGEGALASGQDANEGANKSDLKKTGISQTDLDFVSHLFICSAIGARQIMILFLEKLYLSRGAKRLADIKTFRAKMAGHHQGLLKKSPQELGAHQCTPPWKYGVTTQPQ